MSNGTAMKTVDKSQPESREEREVYLRPSVDIYEEAAGIILKADLPGVSRDGLDIQVDGNTLTLTAQAVIDMPEGMEALYADVGGSRYQRSFTLSKELEVDKITAEMKDGVLTLDLPKRAELQPRKIEIKAG